MNEAEDGVMSITTGRPEDRNARQTREIFEDGATLAELEALIAELRRRGAPDDAHPEVSVNDRNEITAMVCVTKRAAADLSEGRR